FSKKLSASSPAFKPGSKKVVVQRSDTASKDAFEIAQRLQSADRKTVPYGPASDPWYNPYAPRLMSPVPAHSDQGVSVLQPIVIWASQPELRP
ncbi:hypothetical protein EV182_004595, partial [Spiromyces aspiralis]